MDKYNKVSKFSTKIRKHDAIIDKYEKKSVSYICVGWALKFATHMWGYSTLCCLSWGFRSKGWFDRGERLAYSLFLCRLFPKHVPDGQHVDAMKDDV